MPFVHYLFRLPSKLRRKARRSRLALMILLVLLFIIIVAPFHIIYKPPGWLIRYFQYKWPQVLWEVPVAEKVVALTIDDAPSEYTEQIVELLRANDAHATFFVIGSQIDGHEQALKSVVEHGNELGNHAMHDEPSRSLSDTVLAEEIQAVHTAITTVYEAAGVRDRNLYFRPGSGFFSQRLLKNVENLGYKVVLGGVYPHDPQIPYWRINAAHILSMVRPGAIVICHDRRSWTVPMLRKVLPELKRRGYRVVTVSKLLEQANAKKSAGSAASRLH